MKSATFRGFPKGLSDKKDTAGKADGWLKGLFNAFINSDGQPQSRPGTVQKYSGLAGCRGLAAHAGLLHTFCANNPPAAQDGLLIHLVRHPSDNTLALKQVHFAKPLVGYLYVVAEFEDGSVFHYYLRAPDGWKPNNIYKPDDAVSPYQDGQAAVDNGYVYTAQPANPPDAWQPGTDYSVGDVVVPTVATGYKATLIAIDGASGSGATEPDWPAADGAKLQVRVGTNGLSTDEAVAAWQPGTVYAPGEIVTPKTQPAPPSHEIENGDFAQQATSWDLDPLLTIAAGEAFSGQYRVETTGTTTGDQRVLALNQTHILTAPGETISARAMINQGASSAGLAGGRAIICWYDSTFAKIKTTGGEEIESSSGGTWTASHVTGTAPANAAYARVGVDMYTKDRVVAADSIVCTASSYQGVPSNAVYQAVQSVPGRSATSEPDWPDQLGMTVEDGDVIWQAITASRLTWEMSPLMTSGDAMPAWPTDDGATVKDNDIIWTAETKRVTDEKCPNTKVVAIAAGKVYAGDGDTIPYSATNNPLDWHSDNDAGFLPFGMNDFGSTPVEVLALYRSNLVAFNSEGCQVWQVATDPALSSLLDAFPIGSTWLHGAHAVNNDLFFLSKEGVRSLGIAGASTNLEARDVGSPIDRLVQTAMREALANGSAVRANYYPGAGQFWQVFDNYPKQQILSDNEFNGTTQFPSVFDIDVPADASYLQLKFTTGPVPDKFEVWIGGVKVLDTGYYGDQSNQAALDSFLAARGLPSEPIIQYAGTGTDDAESQWAAGDFDTALIHKSSTATKVTIKVYSGGDSSIFHFSLGVAEESTAFVYSMSSTGKVGAWSEYQFPFTVGAQAILAGELYLFYTVGDDTGVLKVGDTALVDFVSRPTGDQPFGSHCDLPLLAFGADGAMKQMVGIDCQVDAPDMAEGDVIVNVVNTTGDGDSATLPADSYPGMVVPLVGMGEKLAVSLDFNGGFAWRLVEMTVYFNEMRPPA